MENGFSIPNVDHPTKSLEKLASQWKTDVTSRSFADSLDDQDSLRHLQDEFLCPSKKDLPGVDLSLVDGDQRCVYMGSHSLGLQPRHLSDRVNEQMDKWAQMAARGYTEGATPWALADEYIDDDMATIVGARRDEVALMNGLTVNLHLMMVSFYRPTPDRYKVIMEKHTFPSDQGEELIRREDILKTIDTEGPSVALVMLPGIHYFTGQLFDIKTITAHAQKQGISVGWDLSHVVGNVALHLHDWNVDFAVWCTYKYLSSGPGGLGGAFMHDRHSHNNFPKLLGWWSNRIETRFQMDHELQLTEGIHGYRISTPSMFLCTAVRASLDVFKKASMSSLREKSRLLTGYLELLLERRLPRNNNGDPWVRIITPKNPDERGSQLSITVSIPVSNAFREIIKRGVVLDVRDPNVIRMSPSPVHNSFSDVYQLVEILCEALNSKM